MSNNKTNLNSIIKKKDNNKPSNFSEKKKKRSFIFPFTSNK